VAASANSSEASMPAVFLHSSRCTWRDWQGTTKGLQQRHSARLLKCRESRPESQRFGLGQNSYYPICYSHVDPLAHTPLKESKPSLLRNANSAHRYPISEGLGQRFKWPSCAWPLAVQHNKEPTLIAMPSPLCH
jgi:hypothetical protein